MFGRTLTLLVSLFLLMTASAFAQDEPSRVHYTTPKSWTLDTDGETLLPAGNRDGPAVVFSPSRPFAGTAEQWATQKWKAITRDMKIVSDPQSGTQGAFLTRTGVFERPDGVRFWVILGTLVQDGRGEAVIFLSTDEALLRKHLPALGQMLQGATVASAQKPAAPAPGAGADTVATPAAPPPAAPATPAAPAPSRGSTIPGGDAVAGLYTVWRQYYAYTPFGTPGSGTYTNGLAYYLLSADGRVFRSVNLEEGTEEHDIRLFDFDAAQRRSPNDSGTYSVRGDEVVLAMKNETLVATRPRRDQLKVGEYTYTRTMLGTDPEAARKYMGGPKNPPKALPVPAASIPNSLPGLPTLTYQKPPGFSRHSGTGMHEARPYWQARVEVYDFRPFRGENFEQEMRATRFRDWLAAESRENALVGDADFEASNADGAEQILTTVFTEEFKGYSILDNGDTRAPRIRSRSAILDSGAVALVDIMIHDLDVWQQHQASLNAFGESMKILPAPPPMKRDEILAIAGTWQDVGTRLSATDSMRNVRAGMKHYIFSLDGRVAWQGDAVEDFRAYNFDPAAKTAGINVGTYFKRGDQLVMRFGRPPYDVYYAHITGPNELEILGHTYHRTQRAEAK